jgi:hypothetical protein
MEPDSTNAELHFHSVATWTNMNSCTDSRWTTSALSGIETPFRNMLLALPGLCGNSQRLSSKNDSLFIECRKHRPRFFFEIAQKRYQRLPTLVL